MISRFNRRLKWHLNTLRSVPSRFFSVIYNLLKTYVFPWMSGKLSRFFPVMVSPLILRRFLGSSRLSAQPPIPPYTQIPFPMGERGPCMRTNLKTKMAKEIPTAWRTKNEHPNAAPA